METYISQWIFTTTRCNLVCPYCYVKQDGRGNMAGYDGVENEEGEYYIYRID